MTFEAFSDMINSIGLPYAYYQFPDGTDVEPPFICFYFSGQNGVFADDSIYARREHFVVELYAKNKDFACEAAVEAALVANDLLYTRNESWIDSEKLIMETYEGEGLINGRYE